MHRPGGGALSRRGCRLGERQILRSSAVAHVLRTNEVAKRLVSETTEWAVIIGTEWERHNPTSPWRLASCAIAADVPP